MELDRKERSDPEPEGKEPERSDPEPSAARENLEQLKKKYAKLKLLEGSKDILKEYKNFEKLDESRNPVFSAVSIVTGKKCSIKRINITTKEGQKELNNFELLQKTRKKLSDPRFEKILANIQVPIEGIKTAKYCYLIYEFVEGIDIYKFVIANRSLIDEVCLMGIFRKMIYILKAIHEAGIIHGDIKPENFIISKMESDIKITLIDFGNSIDQENYEKHGLEFGTPGYTVPARFTNSFADWDSLRRWEYFSLGITFHNITFKTDLKGLLDVKIFKLTGHLPPSFKDYQEKMKKIPIPIYYEGMKGVDDVFKIRKEVVGAFTKLFDFFLLEPFREKKSGFWDEEIPGKAEDPDTKAEETINNLINEIVELRLENISTITIKDDGIFTCTPP